MSPRVLRRIVLVVFVAGIAMMIVSSIKESSGGAITAGIVTAIAAGALILVTSVAPPFSLAPAKNERVGAEHRVGHDHAFEVDEELALDLEQRITSLVGGGADENDIRLLVSCAVDFGRSARRNNR